MAFTSSVDVFIQFVLEIRKQLKLVGEKKRIVASGQLWCMDASQISHSTAVSASALKQVENRTKKKCSPIGFVVPQLEVTEYVSPFKETNAF